MAESGASHLAWALSLTEADILDAVGPDWDRGEPDWHHDAAVTTITGQHESGTPRVVIRVDHQYRIAEIGPARGMQLDDRIKWWPGDPLHVFAIPPYDEVDEELASSPEEQRAVLVAHLQQGVGRALKAWG